MVMYKDFDLSMKLNTQTGDVDPLTDVDAVKNSIENLIRTNKGEALFDIYRGTNLEKLNFSNANYGILDRVRVQIRNAIKNFEPRVDRVIVEVIWDERNYLIKAKIWFRIVGTSSINLLDVDVVGLR